MFEDANKHYDEIIAIRRHLHKHPEVSQCEYETVKYICEKLRELNIELVEVEKGGVLGFIGKKNSSKTVMLRADMDALPVFESECSIGGQKKSCVSEIEGVSHVCGHDAHVAMVLGAAKLLKEREHELNGQVVLFFERAEEGGGNILYLLRYLYNNKINIDGCLALHVHGKIKTGKISIGSGSVNTGSLGFTIKIKGTGGHGSAPSLANNPIDCFVALYNAINLIPTKNIGADKACAFSIGAVNSGLKRNIIPEELSFAGTVRFFDLSVGVIFKSELLRLIECITHAFKCEYEIINFIGPMPPCINNEGCVEIAKNSAATIFGNDNVMPAIFEMSSESFSSVQTLYPGVYAYIGVESQEKGTGGELHNPRFDIDENCLCLGAAFEAEYAVNFLNSDKEISFEKYNGSPDDLYNEICYKVD